jgi:hypothetical protein
MNSTDTVMCAAKFILYTPYNDRDRASKCGSSHEIPFTCTETFSWATFSSPAQSYWAISETETNGLIAFDSAVNIFECLLSSLGVYRDQRRVGLKDRLHYGFFLLNAALSSGEWLIATK